MTPYASSEPDLLALAVALGARTVAGWSAAETTLCRGLPAPPAARVEAARAAIGRGADPLGDTFCTLRSAEARRPSGATYTPAPLVAAMVAWAAAQAPGLVVDPGVGSARFLVAAGRQLPGARLLGVELDPVAAVIARGHLAAAGFAERSEVRLEDFRTLTLPDERPRTCFLGNPPYVRHHGIDPAWKSWLSEAAAGLGLRSSQLAGLHVHFFVTTARLARPGDVGVFVTAAEWLDVNYGSLVRELLAGPLGLTGVTLVEPEAEPFPDALTTAVVTPFVVGSSVPLVPFRRVARLDTLGSLTEGLPVPRSALAPAPRWTPLSRPAPRASGGYVELGELCRVHRGQVTGCNAVWIAGAEAGALPDSLLFPTVTRARELFAAGAALTDTRRLRRVIDLPVDLDTLDAERRAAVDRFLAYARRLGADAGYIARKRRAWWAVGLKEPAPILATYMARRPPAFVRNLGGARHINIAHGVYPREPLAPAVLDALAAFLTRGVSVGDGRTYAGGLTKFEPKEMERLLVPEPARLLDVVRERGGPPA